MDHQWSVFRLQPQTMISFPHFLVERGVSVGGLVHTLGSAAHWPWKDAVPSGISAQLFSDFLWFWPSSEPWLIGCLGTANCARRQVNLDASAHGFTKETQQELVSVNIWGLRRGLDNRMHLGDFFLQLNHKKGSKKGGYMENSLNNMDIWLQIFQLSSKNDWWFILVKLSSLTTFI